MPPRGEAPDVVRIVEGVSGRVRMRTELLLRFDYGHVVPWVRTVDGELAGVAGPDAVWLSGPVQLPATNRGEGEDQCIDGEFEVAAGDQVEFVPTSAKSPVRRPPQAEPGQTLGTTL